MYFDRVALSVFGTSVRAYSRDKSIQSAFADCVSAFGDRPAIVDESAVVTYTQLDQRASRFARRLQRTGLRQGAIVATLTNRSTNTLVAWLAILKCGCTYLPVDPAYPDDFIARILSDAKPQMVLAESAVREGRAFLDDWGVCSIEEELAHSKTEDASAWHVPSAATSPAYIMFTSGSTGQPKGVVVPHRAVLRLVKEQNYMDFNEDEVFLLISALAFDASTWEVWGALLSGARIGIVRGPKISLDQIAAGIAAYGVTSIWLTSALFHMLVDVDVNALRGVRQILVGGDVMSPEHSQKAMAALPDCQLINTYGPTEATTFSVCYRLPRDGWGGGSVPIGMPVAHSRAYILTDSLGETPEGETGQLWVAGDGIALGYLNREELTAERFRPDPFQNDGSQMYNTGDLARMRPDGLIEFLGRNDRQVKIEGKRIELDEIEHALRRDANVADVVVAVKVRDLDDKRIVAFIKPARFPSPAEVKTLVANGLRQRLPSHMIPHVFMLVENFPFTANGKVDRNGLLAQVP